MEKIAQLEHAESPEPKPPQRQFTDKTNDENTQTQMGQVPLPLPCHYFDYIFGSSTGGYYKDFDG